MSLLCLKSLSAQPFQDKDQRLVSACVPTHSFSLATHTHIFCVCLSHTNADICTFLSPTCPLLPSLHPHLFLLSLALSPIPVSLSSQCPPTFHSCFLHIPHLFPSISTTPMSSHCFSLFLSPTHVCTHSFTHTHSLIHTHRILKMLNSLHFLESTTLSPISFN